MVQMKLYKIKAIEIWKTEYFDVTCLYVLVPLFIGDGMTET